MSIYLNDFSISFLRFVFFFFFSTVLFVFTLIMLFLPRYSHSETSPNVIFCSMTIFLESLLLGSTFSMPIIAWLILAWLIAGKLPDLKCFHFFSILKLQIEHHLFIYLFVRLFGFFFCYFRYSYIYTMRYMVFTVR